MKILVTGHRGFIGQHLYARLAATAADVSGYEWSDGDLPDIRGFDAVVHLGAISATTYDDLDQIMTQNYDFSIRLLHECLRHGVDLQYASSASVYGTLTHFDEQGRLQPQSYYAWSKYLFDRYVAAHLESERGKPGGIAIAGLRYFNVYGSTGEEHKGDMASPYSKFCDQALNTGRIRLFHGSDGYLRDFVCVEDVVDISLGFLESRPSGIFNIGTGKPVSFQQVAESIADKYHAAIEYVDMPPAISNQYQAYTCARLERLNSVMEKDWVNILDYITHEGRPAAD